MYLGARVPVSRLSAGSRLALRDQGLDESRPPKVGPAAAPGTLRDEVLGVGQRSSVNSCSSRLTTALALANMLRQLIDVPAPTVRPGWLSCSRRRQTGKSTCFGPLRPDLVRRWRFTRGQWLRGCAYGPVGGGGGRPDLGSRLGQKPRGIPAALDTRLEFNPGQVFAAKLADLFCSNGLMGNIDDNLSKVGPSGRELRSPCPS